MDGFDESCMLRRLLYNLFHLLLNIFHPAKHFILSVCNIFNSAINVVQDSFLGNRIFGHPIDCCINVTRWWLWKPQLTWSNAFSMSSLQRISEHLPFIASTHSLARRASFHDLPTSNKGHL